MKIFMYVTLLILALFSLFLSCNHPDTFLPIEEPATVQYIDATSDGITLPSGKQ